MTTARSITLDLGDWTVQAADSSDVPASIRGRAVPAIVPGCVHLDLLRAGLIGDPDQGMRELEQLWIGETDWTWTGGFWLPAAALDHEHLELVIDAIDTIATIEINGAVVGTAASAHHPHRFDVRAHVREGPNQALVRFRGPLAYAREQEARLGTRPVNGDWGPYAFVRKPACNFGWDWGPRVATCGLTGEARLEAWSGVRVDSVRPLVESAGDGWLIEVRAALRGAASDPLELQSVLSRGGRPVAAARVEVDPGASEARLVLDVPAARAEAWWPRGWGNQPLYELNVAVGEDARARWSRRVGLRTVALDTSPDPAGRRFELSVNGRPIFCLGGNWIPDGLFPAGRTAREYRARIEQACGANLNMLRVWGGGQYERAAFYDACDELGVLVWQDFMFACATYPEETPYPELIEAEARHHVARLAAHPSVVLWCGGNENVEAVESWGWRSKLRSGQSWGALYWFELLPRIVRELDPTRPYWPDSPWSGSREHAPNDPDHGDRHTWDRRVEGYRELVPRFVSEFGHQAPPAWRTLHDAVGHEALVVDGPALAHRQRASAPQYEELAAWFCEPADFDDWHFQAQLLQARALSIGIEWLRANAPRCMGALLWQLNDAWSGLSWSLIDAAGRLKPSWFAVRRACVPRLLTIHPVDGEPSLFAVNDDDEPWRTSVRLRRMRFDGETLRDAPRAVTVPPRGSLPLGPIAEHVEAPRNERARRCEFVVAEADGQRALWLFGRDRALDLEMPELRASVAHADGHCELRVETPLLLRDVVLAVDRLDPAGMVDDQVVTILPGEGHTWRIDSVVRPRFELDELIRPPVLNCANRFAAPQA